LDKVIPEYNNFRPHYSLAGLTLNEAVTGKVIDKNLRHKQLKEAQEKRIAYNKQARCVSVE